MQAAQTPTSKLRFITPDKQSNMNTLWQDPEFEQICSKESLTEKAADIENLIFVKEHESERYDSDPTTFHENHLWNRRPDGMIVINTNHRISFIPEFERWSARNIDFRGVKEDEANEQHESIIQALKVAALEWTFVQMNFVVGRCGAVVEDDFNKKLNRLSAQVGKRNKILVAHVQRICEVHDTVIWSYYQQIHRSFGADATTSMENLGEQMYG